MVNKHTVGYHPSSSQLTSRIHPLIFLWSPKGFISPESFLNFFLNLYYTKVEEKFQIYGVKIIEHLLIFTYTPKQNSAPVFYHCPPGRRKLPIPLE